MTHLTALYALVTGLTALYALVTGLTALYALVTGLTALYALVTALTAAYTLVAVLRSSLFIRFLNPGFFVGPPLSLRLSVGENRQYCQISPNL